MWAAGSLCRQVPADAAASQLGKASVSVLPMLKAMARNRRRVHSSSARNTREFRRNRSSRAIRSDKRTAPRQSPAQACAADCRGAVRLSDRMARLLRFLRNSLGVARPLMNGPGDGCAPSPGSIGSTDTLALPSCDAAASAGTWRHKLPAAHMAPGGSRTAPHSPLLCQRPLLQITRSGLRRRTAAGLISPNRRIRSPSVRWCGRGSVARRSPIPIKRSNRLLAILPTYVRRSRGAESDCYRSVKRLTWPGALPTPPSPFR